MKKKKKKKIKLTPHEIEKRNYRAEVRSIFLKAGFHRIPEISDKEFTYKEAFKSDFDDYFLYENILVFLEYTVSQISNISDHLKPKKIIYDEIHKSKSDFINFLDSKFSNFKSVRSTDYDVDDLKIVILYCSKYDVDLNLKSQIANIKYFDYPILKYFKAVTEAIKLSSRFEIFKFLGLDNKEIGENVFNTTIAKKEIHGSMLPEKHSNFKKGYKVVSFYIDPFTLLKSCYVLRKDGWHHEEGVYQRMIIKSKLSSIRKYLLNEERVFLNNIIITLPPNTKIKDDKKDTVRTDAIQDTQPVIIEIPDSFNTLGLIDGQHRVFAYHEGGENDTAIASLRKKQNLLVTGIIYPEKLKESEKSQFEAKLFLEINANQSNAKSDLKQAIGLLLNPFSTESIARFVVYRLNTSGSLMNKFEKHFYEKDKMKTTSIVSYGLKPIVKLNGNDSLFYLWNNPKKEDLLKNQDRDLLDEYIKYCSVELTIFFDAFKNSVDISTWTTARTSKTKILSTTTINGIIVCFRLLIENNKTGDFNLYKKRLTGVNAFSFNKYKSSQYGSLGKNLYNKFFK